MSTPLLGLRRTLLAVVAALAASGCGGGGGTSRSVPPAAATARPASAAVAISILIPKSSQSALRRPHYISSATQSASVAVNGGTPAVLNLTSGSPGCAQVSGGLQCTMSVSAPPGNDTFDVTLYGQTNAEGPALSHASTSSPIVPGTANTVTMTLYGVVSSIVIALSDPSPAIGTPETIGVTVSAKDASGQVIVGDPYDTPITLTDSDTTGAAPLSKTTLSAPSDAQGLSVAYNGAAIGTVTIGATGTAGNVTSASFTPRSGGSTGQNAFNDWPTYAYDNKRDGYNPNSGNLTPASLPSLHLAWQNIGFDNDYNTQTQPILATNVGGHAGILFAGGTSGILSAFDALSGTQLWTRQLGTLKYACDSGNSDSIGVEGTPVYDPASQTVYSMSNSNAGVDAPTDTQIVRLNAATGAIQSQISIQPNNLGGEINAARDALALAGGRVYLGTSSPCDKTPWRGRVAAVHSDLSGGPLLFYTDYNGYVDDGGYSGGGVWGWGGVSIDDAGNVYAGVGNTDQGTQGPSYATATSETAGLGDHLIQMPPDLSALLGSNYPGFTFGGSSDDLDFTGTPILFRPVGCSDTLVATQGKEGSVFVYDTNTINDGPIARIRIAPSTDQAGSIGNPAYSPLTGLLYVSVVSSSGGGLYAPGIVALRPAGCNAATTFTAAWNTGFGPDSYANPLSITPRSAPVATAGNLLLVGTPCTSDGNGGCQAQIGANGGALWALDARTGTLLDGGKPVLQTPVHIRMAPVVDGDWVFVLDDNADLYGLTIDPNYKAISATTHKAIRHRKVWAARHLRR